MTEPDPDVYVLAPAEMQVGIWANSTRVSVSPYELTIDFARIDYGGRTEDGDILGQLVQRINVSPMLAVELIQELTAAMDEYSRHVVEGEIGTVDDDEGEQA